MVGPERRVHDVGRMDPYSRPAPPALQPIALPTLDPATQAAIQAAAAAAAAAAIAQQQRQAVALPPAQAGAASAPTQLPNMPKFVKVSGDSDPRKVAGKLAHTCREDAAPAMLTIGTKCINQAVKAICIARGYLADQQIELTFQTAFREGGSQERPSVALYLSKHSNSKWVPQQHEHELSVSGSSNPTTVAGALASRCRDSQAACLIGIGMDAVTNAVLSIGHTRLYLEHDGMDIRAWPEFVKVQKNGGELNAIKFHIHVDRIR